MQKLYTLILTILFGAFAVQAQAQFGEKSPQPDPFSNKSRLFVLSDIGNEPDDQMSAVRLLLYANELDIEGIAAVTSAHLRNKLHPEILHELVKAYGEVRPNLMQHARGWPSEKTLSHVITTGPTAFGMDGIDPKNPSLATKALIKATDRADERPLWVSIWGGANTLAEALSVVRQNRDDKAVEQFVAKLRVYSISDQDDAGTWIRREFPTLQYVVSPSGSAEDYATATWTGISGDRLYGNDIEFADASRISQEWLDTHIRQGPLGSLYPKVEYIMEGDTPAFLGLIANGLNSASSPAWGGWGGHYVYRQPYGENRAIWTQGGMALYGVSSRDRVTGVDGQIVYSDQATIWRWRNAFQNDFAARITWSVSPDVSRTNHRPTALIAGHNDLGPIVLSVKPGEPVTLDATPSTDPDPGQHLKFNWFHYPEAGARLTPLTDVQISGARSAKATIVAEKTCRPALTFMTVPCSVGKAHVILEVIDDGVPSLTTYRRVILHVQASE